MIIRFGAPPPFLEASMRPRIRGLRVWNLAAGSGWGGPGGCGQQVGRGEARCLEGQLWGLQSLQQARTGSPSPDGLSKKSCHQPPSLDLTLIPLYDLVDT